MYSLVIADDEAFIREQLTDMTDWSKAGFELKAALKDGKEVIELLSREEIDLVISDIKMIRVSGIELAEFIYENGLNTKVILISGYEDFEYARSAVKYNVSAYLLKPATYNELMDAVGKVRNDLDETKRIPAFFAPMLKKQIFSELLAGTYDNLEDAARKIQDYRLGIDLNNSLFCVIKVKFAGFDEFLRKNWKYGEARFNNAVSNILTRDENGIFIYVPGHYYGTADVLAVASGLSEQAFLSEIETYMKRAERDFSEMFFIQMEYNAGEIISDVTALPHRYSMAKIGIVGKYDGVFGERDIMEKALAFIHLNFTRDISLEDAAMEVNQNSSYFSRFFKEKMGIGFVKYLNRYRVERAREILMNTNLKLSDIYKMTGFNDIGHFHRIFKSETGSTPNEYRRNS